MRAGDDEGMMAGFRVLCNQPRGGWQGGLKRNWWERILSVSEQRIPLGRDELFGGKNNYRQ